MQAPLSSTASGQPPRTGTSADLPPHLQGRALLGDGSVRPRPAARFGTSTHRFPPTQIADGPGLAHDAGNLLGALRLYCDLLARPGVLREEHRHYAAELQLLSTRSAALIDRLLDPATTRLLDAATRLGQRTLHAPGGQAPAPVPMYERVVVPEVIEQCRGLLSTIARRAVRVACDAGVSLPVAAPREAVERILVNLTKNAAEASAGGGAITLRVSRARPEDGRHGGDASSGAPGRIVLSVEDQGRGMTVAAVKVLLDRDPAAAWALRPSGSPEAAAASPEGPARGLGLRIVRELVQQSGGELRLKSASGCGTTVEIAWAIAAEPEDTVRAPSRQRELSAAWEQLAAWDGISGMGTDEVDEISDGEEIYGIDSTKGSVAC